MALVNTLVSCLHFARPKLTDGCNMVSNRGAEDERKRRCEGKGAEEDDGRRRGGGGEERRAGDETSAREETRLRVLPLQIVQALHVPVVVDPAVGRTWL